VKIVKCKQGGPAWLKARLGIPTASKARAWSEVVTPGGRVSKSDKRRTYMLELAAERILGETEDHYVTAAMERGTLLEPAARAWYSIKRGVDVEEVGLCLSDCLRWGASPDGLVADGGIEIKCPMPKRFIAAALGDIAEYLPQVHACIWVCERAWWDVVIYSDRQRLPAVVHRVWRNDALCKVYDEAVPAFCDELDAMEAQLKAMGMGEEAADARTAQWLEDFGAGKFGGVTVNDGNTKEG